MNEILVESIRQNMERKTTEELFETWKEAIKEHRSEETIEAIQRVLTARGEKLPSRTLMATSTKITIGSIISFSVVLVLWALINEQMDIGLLPILLFIVLASIIVGNLWHLGQALGGNSQKRLDYLNSLRSKRFLFWFIFLNIWPLGLALLGRLQIPYVSGVASSLAFLAILFLDKYSRHTLSHAWRVSCRRIWCSSWSLRLCHHRIVLDLGCLCHHQIL